jgi:hypothetical protein
MYASAVDISIRGLQQGKGLGSIGFVLCAAISILIQKAAFKSETRNTPSPLGLGGGEQE